MNASDQGPDAITPADLIRTQLHYTIDLANALMRLSDKSDVQGADDDLMSRLQDDEGDVLRSAVLLTSMLLTEATGDLPDFFDRLDARLGFVADTDYSDLELDYHTDGACTPLYNLYCSPARKA